MAQAWNRLEQFKILNIVEITNVTVFSIIVIGLAVKLIRSRLGRIIYNQTKEMEESVVTKGDGIMVVVLMIMILISNLIGLLRYSYTITSQFIITIGWSMMILIGITYKGIRRKGLTMMSNFVRTGTRILLVRLLTWIEIISYMSRGLSLGIRLGANMLAGHCLLKIVIGFGWELLSGLWLIIRIMVIGGLLMLELGIALLQAYVFTILVCYYNKDIE